MIAYKKTDRTRTFTVSRSICAEIEESCGVNINASGRLLLKTLIENHARRTEPNLLSYPEALKSARRFGHLMDCFSESLATAPRLSVACPCQKIRPDPCR